MAEDRQLGITWSRDGCARRIALLMELHEPRLSMSELSRDSGVPYVQVQNLRDGEFLPSDGDARSIAGALDVPMEALRVIDLGPEGADHGAANIAARALAQAGWIFGLEPAAHDGRTVLAPTDLFMEAAISDWARARSEILGGRERTPTGRPTKAAREAYLRWTLGYGRGERPEWLRRDLDAGEPGIAALPAPMAERRVADRIAWRDAHQTGGADGGDGVRRLATGWYSSQLKRLRRAAGLTQAGLAERSGASLSAIKSYETGRRVPKARVNEAIARALGAVPEAFVTYDVASPLQLVHTLMDIADRLGMEPSIEGGAHIEAVKPTAMRLFEGWHGAWTALAGGDGAAFLDWYDRHDDADRRTRTRGVGGADAAAS